MNFGNGNVGFVSNAPAAAAPTVTAANNGLSLNGTTAVLGNDIDDPLSPAALLSNREITGFHTLFIKDIVSPGTKNYTSYNPFYVVLRQLSALGITPAVTLSDYAGGQSQLLPQALSITDVLSNNPSIELLTNTPGDGYTIRNNAGVFQVDDGGAIGRFIIDQINLLYQFGNFTSGTNFLTIDDLNNNIFIGAGSSGQSSFVLDGAGNVSAIALNFNNYLLLDQANDNYKIGDIETANTGATWEVDAFNQKFIASTTSGAFKYLSIDAGLDFYQIGDIDVNASGIKLAVAGITEEMIFQDGGANRFLDLNASGSFYQIGDINGRLNNTFLNIDDAGKTFNINAVNGVSINATPGFTGTVTPVTSITVQGGIVTNVT